MPPPPAGPSGPAGERPVMRSETSMPSRLVILAALLFALVLPASASAHARLQSTTPQAGAALDRAPATVTVRFDEAVESAFGALTVTDAKGERVDDGRLMRLPGNGSAVSVALRRGLRDGAYTADYRVVSDDGHPVAGAFAFRVGPGGPSPAATVARPAQTPPAAQLYDMNRTGGYLALALGIGTLLFLLACWQPALREASGPEPRWRDAAGAVAAIGAAAALLVATPALTGHAAAQSPAAALLPLDVVHVAAMCAWLGGLASIAVLVPAAGRRLEPAERAQLLAAALTRFSPVALGSVLALAATGVAQAWLHLHRVDALTSTAYGRAVVIKVALLVVLIGLGALNRQRTLPRLRAVAAGGQTPRRAAGTLRSTIAREIAPLVAVLARLGAPVCYSPPPP